MFKYLLSIFTSPKPLMPGKEIYDKVIELLQSGVEFKIIKDKYIRIDSNTHKYFVDTWNYRVVSDFALNSLFYVHKNIGIAIVKTTYTDENRIEINNDAYRLCVFYDDIFIPLNRKNAEHLWKIKTTFYLKNKVSKMDKEFYVVDKTEYMNYSKYMASEKAKRKKEEN